MTPFELGEPQTIGEPLALLDPDDPAVRPIAGGTARRRIFLAALSMLLVAGTASTAAAQPLRLKDLVVGSWALVSARASRPDGSVHAPYGPRAVGTLLFDANGHCAMTVINPDIPKFASNDRDRPTPQEAMAAATGSFVMFGSYSVNGLERSVTIHVDASSFPNFNGTDQKSMIKSTSPNELVLDNPASPKGGAIELAFRRLE